MLWKIQEICSKMGTKIIEIDEVMSVIIHAKGGNPQNSTGKKQKMCQFKPTLKCNIFPGLYFQKIL